MNKWIGLIGIILFITGCTEQEQQSNHQVSNKIVAEVKSTHETVDKEEPPIVVKEKQSPEEIQEARIEEQLQKMSLEEQVGQLFYTTLADYQGTGLPVGGVILFKEDLPSKEMVIELTEYLQARSTIPLFIGTDEEGGLVTRITGKDSLGGTQIPTAWTLAHEKDQRAVYVANKIIGRELAELGINMNFAPVADTYSNPTNKVIGHRAFSDQVDQVIEGVEQAVEAYEDANILPVIKHYPGHGDTMGDSHLGTVSVQDSWEELKVGALEPFIKGIEMDVPIIMVGHIGVPKVTGTDIPASLSSILIQELLIDELGFKGLVITDALNMGSITQRYTTQEVMKQGLEAGVTIFLMPDDLEEAYAYLLQQAKENPYVQEKIQESVKKILGLKIQSDLG